MLRHTDLLFHAEHESTSLLNDNEQNGGGLSLFFKSLIKLIGNDRDNWEITLVGHSMGTIVANKIVKEFGNQLPIKKIVYLAAADSIQNYQDTIHRYLQNEKNYDTKMYHFVLHPRAEEGEKNPRYFDLTPRGSLLVWLDNFLSKPLSLQQRTIGRFDNLMKILHDTPKKIQNRIYLRVYSAGNDAEGDNPLTHSDVAGRFKFWEESCLESNSKINHCIVN